MPTRQEGSLTPRSLNQAQPVNVTMSSKQPFDPQNFLPYRLNMAAEAAGIGFQKVYKSRYGMLRTEWRVLFHLGAYGAMTATDIHRRSSVDKAKISRAVSSLRERGWLEAEQPKTDRRQYILSLSPAGRDTYRELCAIAEAYDAKLAALFSDRDAQVLRHALKILSSETLPEA